MKSEAEMLSEGRKQTDFAKLPPGAGRWRAPNKNVNIVKRLFSGLDEIHFKKRCTVNLSQYINHFLNN